MDHHWVARVLLSLLCAIQGIATVAIDLNRTHATNPLWPGHARFHVVWQTLAVALMSVVELGLLWGRVMSVERGFYLAMLLAGISPVAFLLTCVVRKGFGATLSDPNGIPPMRIKVGSRTVSADGNLAAVVLALISLFVFLLIFRS